MSLNPFLLHAAKEAASRSKVAFVQPAQAAQGDPTNPQQAPPGGDPAAAGGDPAAAGAPPGADPAAAGAPAGGIDPAMLQSMVQQTVQQVMAAQGGGAAGGGAARRTGGGKNDDSARELYQLKAWMTSIGNALGVQPPPEALLGLPPGSDHAAALAAQSQGQDPNAAQGGGDPAQAQQAQPQQQPINFAPAVAPKTAAATVDSDDDDTDIEKIGTGINRSNQSPAMVSLPVGSFSGTDPVTKLAEVVNSNLQQSAQRAEALHYLLAAVNRGNHAAVRNR